MIKIYVTSIASYNTGRAGRWFDLPCSEGKIRVALEVTEDTELMITDYESPFKVGEYDAIETLNQYAERMEDVPQHILKDMNELLGNGYESIEDILDDLEKYYFVEGVTTDRELGELLVDEELWHQIPSELVSYIDKEQYGRDYRFSSDLFYTDSGVYMR